MKPAPTGSPTEYDGHSPTMSGRQSPDPSRRETIMSLVEMLLQNNSDSGEMRNHQMPSFEDDRDVPSVDEHLQAVGAEGFNRLQRRINNLDKELRNFANAARQLGSSVAILSSAFHLRERLAQLLFLYQENAADLFPRKVVHIVREIVPGSPATSRRRRNFRRVKGKAQLHVPRPTVAENIDPESFPDQLEYLAKEVTTFLKCLNEFPEFTDEAVNASILSFEGDLKYWSSCLKEYSGQFRYPAVQRYIHDLSAEMGHHLDDLTSSLSMFIEVGVPTIRFAQKHGANNLLNLSTVATFFSAVTATTLQFSYALDRSDIADSVNCFWFASMVFSIAAAVNSLLGLTWKQAMYRSPGHRVPWWVLIWIKRSPLVFLVLSVACFSVGLCCFAYASRQAPVTSTVTTVLTAFTSFGLAAVSTWFASERWAFSRHKGQKWLSDILYEANQRFLMLSGVTWMRRVHYASTRQLRKLRRGAFRAAARFTGCSKLFPVTNHEDEDDDLEASTLPASMRLPYSSILKEGTLSHNKCGLSDISNTPIASEVSLTPPSVPFGPSSESSAVEQIPISPPSPNAVSPTLGKQLWKNAVRNVRMRNALSTLPAPTSVATVINQPRAEPLRQRSLSSSLGFPDRKYTIAEYVPFTRSRVSALVPKLVELEATHDLAAHTALVRHMQFSPDGKYLATSSWDKTAVIFKVGHPFIPHRTLAHPQGFVGQVAWSPNGKILLTKMTRGVKVWTARDGVCKGTINRDTPIETITWCPNGDAFLSIEHSTVTKLDLAGNVLDQYEFKNMKLHDVAITPDSQRILGVGPLLRSPNNLNPSKSRVEKRLVVYNMDTKQVESLTPVLEDVKDITVAQTAQSGLVALISYEHKAPPQLWKLELVKDRDHGLATTSRLTLRHTYMPKVLVDFAGPSYFGGQNNELVLCAGKAGDIHIWDQESGALLHFIRAQAHGGDMTCMAWNHAASVPFMFAAGSHDGAVRVWTRHPSSTSVDTTEFHHQSLLYQMENNNISGSSLSLGESTHVHATSFDDSRHTITSASE